MVLYNIFLFHCQEMLINGNNKIFTIGAQYGSLLITWVCFDPEPAWEGGFPEIMT